MNTIRSWGRALFMIFIFMIPAFADDMRAVNREALERERTMMEKAKIELEQAGLEAEQSRMRIMADRDALNSEMERLERENQRLKDMVAGQERLIAELSETEKAVEKALGEKRSMVGELVGLIRTGASDLTALLKAGPQTALNPDRGDFLKPLTEKTAFPGMDEIRKMFDLLEEERTLSGNVRLVRGRFIDRSGAEREGDILMPGNFSSAYRIDGETGFLSFSETDRMFHALNKLPPRWMRSRLNAYMDGKSDDVPVDISRGGALRQLTHDLSLWEKIRRGGPIVWPILLIPVLAVLIFVERGVFFFRRRLDADDFFMRFNALMEQKDWDGCVRLCQRHEKSPLAGILRAGIEFRRMERTDMENALQEAILRHAPGQERFVAALGILASIAPLLGLLGTVTGMINTFHVITYLGTGDPRMMSGGISEALITTMLGLSVAIPIMLGHTILNRHAEKTIARMEEKAVAFVNAVYRNRG